MMEVGFNLPKLLSNIGSGELMFEMDSNWDSEIGFEISRSNHKQRCVDL